MGTCALGPATLLGAQGPPGSYLALVPCPPLLHMSPPPPATCSSAVPSCRHHPLHGAGDGALSAPPSWAPDIPWKPMPRRTFLHLTSALPSLQMEGSLQMEVL